MAIDFFKKEEGTEKLNEPKMDGKNKSQLDKTTPSLDKEKVEEKDDILTKKVKSKSKKSSKKGKGILGPVTKTFYGRQIKLYYNSKNKEWLFSLEDILPLGEVNNLDKFIDELKKDKKYDAIFAGEKISEFTFENPIDKEKQKTRCVNKDILTKLIRISGKLFPGPIIRWIEATSKSQYQSDKSREASAKKERTPSDKETNPMEGGS